MDGPDSIVEDGDHGTIEIPPEPQRIDMASLPSPSSHVQPLPILPSPQRAPKRRKVVQAMDDDIFKSLPPSPQPDFTSPRPVPPIPQKQRALPVLEQGPYVSAYTSIQGDSRLSPSGRRQSGVEDDVTKTVWPPKRGATNRKATLPEHQGSFEKPSHLSIPAPHPMFDNDPHRSHGSPTPLPLEASLQSNKAALVQPPSLPDRTDTALPGSTDHFPLQRNRKSMSPVQSSPLTNGSDQRGSTAQPNAIATSSRVQLTPERSKHPVDSRRPEHPIPAVPDPKPSDSPAPLRASPAPTFKFPMSRTTDPRRKLFQNMPKPVNAIPTRVAEDVKNARRRTLAGFPEEVPPHLDLLSATKHLRGHVLDHDRRQSLPPSSILSASRQSTLPEVVYEHTLHRTSSITSANTDYWNSYPRRQYNPTSPSRHSSTSASVSVVSQLPESERRLTMELGAQVVLQRMAENHGLQEKLVRDIWERTNSFEKTDKVCRQMHLAMRRAYEEACAELAPSDEDEDEGSDKDWDDPRGEVIPLSRLSAEHTATRSPKQPIQASNGLKYIPSPADAVPEHMTPALHTRAAQFVRLERQGRMDEAKKREGRRASYGGSKRVEDSPQKQSFTQPQDDEGDKLDDEGDKLDDEGDEFDDEDMYLNEEDIEAGPAVEDEDEDEGEGKGEDQGAGKDGDEDEVEITEERIDLEKTGEGEVVEESVIDPGEWMEETGGIDEDELDEEFIEEDAMDEDLLVEEGLQEDLDPAELEQGSPEGPMDDTGDVDDESLGEIAIVNEDAVAEEDALDEDVVEKDVPQVSNPAEPEQDDLDTVDVDESAIKVVVDLDEDYEEQADFLPRLPSPRAPVSPSSWGSYEDKLLVDGDEDALDDLEAKMGPGSVKIRTAWLYSQFLFTAS